MDASWWNGLTQRDKFRTVAGLMEGFDVGYEAGAAAASIRAQKGEAFYLKVRSQRVRLTVTFGTASDRIDAVYREHPKVANISVGHFIECAASTKVSCDDTAALYEH